MRLRPHVCDVLFCVLVVIIFLMTLLMAIRSEAAPLASQYGSVGSSVDSNANFGGSLVPYAQSQLTGSVACAAGAITVSTIALVDASGFDATGGTASLEDNTGHANNFTYTSISSNVMHGVANVSNGQLKPCVATYNVSGSRVYASTSATSYALRLNTTNAAIQRTQSVLGVGKVSLTALGVTTLATAVAAIGAAQAELVIDRTISYGSGTTVPSTMTLSFTPSGLLDCNSVATAITIQGTINADVRPIFTNCPAGSVVLTGNPKLLRVYPQWWGAAGGVTDNGVPLAAALAAVANGGTIFLTDNFRIITPWVFSNIHNVQVQGQPGAQITQATINTVGIQIRNGSSHITLRDFILDGPHTHGDAINNRDGVLIGDETSNDGGTTKDDITVERLTISGFTHSGVGVIGLNNGGVPSANTNIHILHNTITDCQNGIFIYKGAVHVLIDSNLIQNTWYDGIAIDTRAASDSDILNISVANTDINITNNTIDGSGIDGQAVGILLKGLIIDAKIQHNTLRNIGVNQAVGAMASFGILTEADYQNSAGKNQLIAENAIDNIVSLSGSALGMSINDTLGTTIAGNTISNIMDSVGIDINQVDTVTVTGNTLYAVGGCGIPALRLTRQTVAGATTHAVVSSNVIVDPRDATNDCSPLKKTTLGIQADWVDGLQVIGNYTSPGITQGVGFTANALNYVSVGNADNLMSTLVESPLFVIGAANDLSAHPTNGTLEFTSAGVVVGRMLYAGVNGAGNRYMGLLADNGADGFRLFSQNAALTALERLRVTGAADVANTEWSSTNVSVSPGAAVVPTAALQVNGGMRLNTATARPTCDSTQEGTTWVTTHSGGVATALAMCMADAGGVFTWTVY